METQNKHELKPAGGIVSAGFDDFRWPHPVLVLREGPRSATAHTPSMQADGAKVQLSKLKVVARQARPKHHQHPLIAKNPQAPERRSVARVMLPWTSRLATLVIALLAVLVSIAAWGHYVRAPWTRDGRIRAQVASVAPQISGQITELRIAAVSYTHLTLPTILLV